MHRRDGRGSDAGSRQRVAAREDSTPVASKGRGPSTSSAPEASSRRARAGDPILPGTRSTAPRGSADRQEPVAQGPRRDLRPGTQADDGVGSGLNRQGEPPVHDPSTSASTRCDFSSRPRKLRRARRATETRSASPAGRAAGSRGCARNLRRVAPPSAVRRTVSPRRHSGPMKPDRLSSKTRLAAGSRPSAARALGGRRKQAGQLEDPDVEVGGHRRGGAPAKRESMACRSTGRRAPPDRSPTRRSPDSRRRRRRRSACSRSFDRENEGRIGSSNRSIRAPGLPLEENDAGFGHRLEAPKERAAGATGPLRDAPPPAGVAGQERHDPVLSWSGYVPRTKASVERSPTGRL